MKAVMIHSRKNKHDLNDIDPNFNKCTRIKNGKKTQYVPSICSISSNTKNGYMNSLYNTSK